MASRHRGELGISAKNFTVRREREREREQQIRIIVKTNARIKRGLIKSSRRPRVHAAPL